MNKGGGSVYKTDDLIEIGKVCRENSLKYHLDGARIFNALHVSGQTAQECGQLFDSISICLSKGLGAPVGSVLLGDKDFIKKARRVRKVFGGAMRQAGYLAAAGIYALDNNIERLKEDHLKAKKLAECLYSLPWVEKTYECQTNIVLFTVKPPLTAIPVLKKLAEAGLHGIDFDKMTIRFVTHLDFNESMLEETINVLRNFNPEVI
jgi:threonine aldolase